MEEIVEFEMTVKVFAKVNQIDGKPLTKEDAINKAKDSVLSEFGVDVVRGVAREFSCHVVGGTEEFLNDRKKRPAPKTERWWHRFV